VADERLARAERYALADVMAELGPDAPTLNTGWTIRDLAAHVIVRERRLDGAAGILVRGLREHSEKVRRAVADRPFDELVAEVRHPPWWTFSAIPLLDVLVNTSEFFIHHEDVRRAQPGWEPRDLPVVVERELWRRVRSSARLALRRFRAVVVLHAPGYGESTFGVSDSPTRVRVSGPPGELLMFVSGRQRAARVEVTGPQPTVDSLRRARLGV